MLRLIIDKRTVSLLPENEQLQFKSAAREFGIEIVPFADDPILDYAEEVDATVISGDYFVDQRRRRPWIEEQPERFVTWEQEGGATVFRTGHIEHEQDRKVSAAEQEAEFKGARIDPRRHHKILETRWRCLSRACGEGRNRQGELLSWPVIDRYDRACCPECKRELISLGPRGVYRQVVVTAVGSEVGLLRFPLEKGLPVVLGRGWLEDGIGLEAVPGMPPEVTKISSVHLLLKLESRDVLTVVDLGSRNGSTVHRDGAAAARGKYQADRGPGQVLTADTPERIGDDDCVRLAGVVQIELSGQRYTTDTVLPDYGSDDVVGTDINLNH
ncbi:hypothetical protein [Dactylosporangium sp. CA-092794]|uniref:hypothetical protein n=1 Tax=Dactylosporangium sp. CA-092794 TaxID=3239929 RepID=UPI003D8A6743